jgi:hypothetical protein
MNLNSIYKGSNQNIVSMKTIANLKTNGISVVRNQRPFYVGQNGSSWSINTGGSDFTGAVNGFTAKLKNSITATSSTIELKDSSSALPSVGILLIDNEYIKYSANNTITNTLTVDTRGYRETAPAAHLSEAIITVSYKGSTYVRTSATNIPNNYIEWNLLEASSFPSGKSSKRLDIWMAIRIDQPTLSSETTTTFANTANGRSTSKLYLSSISNFLVGAYLGGSSYIPNGAYITAVDSVNKTVTMSTSASVPAGVKVSVTNRPQSAQIKLWNSDLVLPKYFNFKTILYKGDFLDDTARQVSGNTFVNPQITYNLNDYVTYTNPDTGQVDLYISTDTTNGGNDNRHSITAGGDNAYWKLVDTNVAGETSSYRWIRISLYKDGSIWKNNLPNDSTLSFGQYLNPNALRISITNANTYSLPFTKNIGIGNIYADQYSLGSLNTEGSEILQGQLWLNGTQYSDQTGARISFNNTSTNGWISSGYGLNLNQFTQSALDGPMYLKFVPISARSQSYLRSDITNLNINTAYIEVKMTETLATKGTPIVSMG